MTPERWARIEALYHQAQARPPGDRVAFLAEACADDETLRHEVGSLLAESVSDDSFLAKPALAFPPPGLTDRFPATRVGTSLGGYELQALLGAGGMGEVYRAHDGKLGRHVAIKILPGAFTSHPDRLARFAREARMLAALNHPNICAIYGFEDAGGIRLLVLELVEGQTLADTLAPVSGAKGGGLPWEQARTVARQIADALEVAHDKGIVHRDLKPANIKITPDGAVKVLDFGLAKAVGGEGSAPDLSNAPLDAGDRREGAVIGTAAYMSPEQARGLPVDRRTDIWAFGCVLYEMLTGRVAFAGDTASDSIAKILERDPDWTALPPETPASIRRLLLRCLAKDPKKRLRDVADVRLEIDTVDDALPGLALTAGPASAGTRPTLLPWVAVAALVAAVGLWEGLRPVPWENPLPSDGFTLVTDWPGSEGHAEISPDGKVVAFYADVEGEVDLFSSQVGSGVVENLTQGIESLTNVAIYRRTGFSADSARVWFGGAGPSRRQKVEVPWSGGVPRPFLVDGAQAPAWSSDDRLVYFDQFDEDALSIADGAGRNARRIPIDWPAADKAPHNHNMVWSPDNQWIYFVHGDVRDWNHQSDDMDIWRIRPSGGSPERLTNLNASVTFLAMLDQDTLVFIAPERDGAGSWLWSLDVGTIRGRWWWPSLTTPRRIPTGLDQYTSVSASRGRGPLVATRAKPTASLWRVPVLGERPAGEADAVQLELQTQRALAPRYARRAVSPSLFHLSARGTGDRLWGFTTTSFEITKGAEGHLSETPAPAPDGSRVAVVVREADRRHVAVMNHDGQGSQVLAASIDIQGAIDWSPDGGWIAAGGRDAAGAGLFVIPVDGGTPRRLVSGIAIDPAWSPNADFLLYSGMISGGSATGRTPGSPLKAVRPDGRAYELPLVTAQSGAREDLRVTPGGYRFADQTHLVYRPSPQALDFWLFDLVTGERRQLTRLANKGSLRGFDVTPNATHVVFDRVLQHSDIVLIERPKR